MTIAGTQREARGSSPCCHQEGTCAPYGSCSVLQWICTALQPESNTLQADGWYCCLQDKAPAKPVNPLFEKREKRFGEHHGIAELSIAGEISYMSASAASTWPWLRLRWTPMGHESGSR